MTTAALYARVSSKRQARDQTIGSQTAELRGTVRTLTPEVRQLVEKRIAEVVKGVALLTGATLSEAKW